MTFSDQFMKKPKHVPASPPWVSLGSF